MSRDGFDDCDDPMPQGLWEGALRKSVEGKRGQDLLKSLRRALDEMDVKELERGVFERGSCFCALGALAKSEGIDIYDIQKELINFGHVDFDRLSSKFHAAKTLLREIMFINDQGGTKADRWAAVRQWTDGKIKI